LQQRSDNDSMIEIKDSELRPISNVENEPQLKNSDQEMIEYLEKQINIIKKSKESNVKKNEYKISK
jgi:hypothetical protein